METRSVGWRCRPGRPAASPARPTASRWLVPGGSTNRSPTAVPAARSSSTGSSPRRSPPPTPRTTKTAKTSPGPAGTSPSPTPTRTDFLGTSHLEATGDTLTLKTFYDQVCAIAHQLFLDGDTNPLGAARSKPSASSPANPLLPPSRRSRCTPSVESRDLEPDALAVGEIEKRGAATLTKIRDWVGHHQVVIQPVLNMTRRDAVDSHDPPGWMRDLVTPPRRTLHLPQMPSRRQVLRPRPHQPLRRERTTRPNPTREPRRPLPATPPRQDQPDAGATSARPTATTPGTAPTARATSSRRGAPRGSPASASERAVEEPVRRLSRRRPCDRCPWCGARCPVAAGALRRRRPSGQRRRLRSRARSACRR